VKISRVEDLKGQWGFPKGDISKKIPLDSAVAKYLATAPYGNRYRLEESAIAS
jgi:hypothetical protein